MTLKYLYISGAYTFEGLFPYLHVPIDNYIFSIAKKELGIPQPKISWSRWDDYKGQYMAYQTTLRSKIHGYYPLRWEFKFWMKEAHQLELETNIANDTSEKILILRELKQRDRVSESYFYDILERIGIIKNNYGDYMTTAPIDCDTELQRLPDADYDLTCALITMLLREDHFNNGAFERRYRAGQVQPILQRMINLLTAERS